MHHVTAVTQMRPTFRFPLLYFAVFAASAAAACTDASTSVIAPTANKCQIAASASASSYTASGGSGTIAVATARDCQWTIAADASWVAITGPRTGQGDAAVAYTVAANPVPTPRAAAIAVGSVEIQLSQAAAPCRYELNRSGDSVQADGGHLSVNITTLTGCAWTATSTVDWITIASGQSGNASATVTLTVAANTGAARGADVIIGGQKYVVSQAAVPAAPPAPAPTPSPSPAPSPTPTPTPTPTPAPPPEEVDFTGRVSRLSGRCNNVSFSAAGRQVVTDNDTDFSRGRCRDLSNGDTVNVRGVLVADVVRASRVRFENDNDDD
jgi:hypothetical protein